LVASAALVLDRVVQAGAGTGMLMPLIMHVRRDISAEKAAARPSITLEICFLACSWMLINNFTLIVIRRRLL
jgi:hypothetical protein